jgi:DNA-entry nuclease
MLPFENLVADYVKETGNHVMYRVTPDFEGNNLVATGVTMEAYSVEDNGDGIQFCVYVYNFQPGILIDYATGKSRLDDGTPIPDGSTENGEKDDTGTGESDEMTYILNTSSKKFHDPDCSNAANISDKNREKITCTRDELIYRGYEPCGICKP